VHQRADRSAHAQSAANRRQLVQSPIRNDKSAWIPGLQVGNDRVALDTFVAGDSAKDPAKCCAKALVEKPLRVKSRRACAILFQSPQFNNALLPKLARPRPQAPAWVQIHRRSVLQALLRAWGLPDAPPPGM